MIDSSKYSSSSFKCSSNGKRINSFKYKKSNDKRDNLFDAIKLLKFPSFLFVNEKTNLLVVIIL